MVGLSSKVTAVAALFISSLQPIQAATGNLGYATQLLNVQGVAQNDRIPVGYKLELLTTDLDQPRLLTFAANGDLFIVSKSGDVYRVTPTYTRPAVFANLGGYPHSIAFRPGEIFVASEEGLYFTSDSETSGLFRLRRAR